MPDAAGLQIAGLVPLSTVDWPGKLAASIFLQGCPWRCVYCQNHEILDPRTPGSVPWSQVVELLQRRRGLLDGLVFSGGEATRQPGLLSAAQEVKALGFAVGLHTAGIYPGNLARLLAADAVDWVGLDIKALPGPDYQQVVARGGGGEKAWLALELV
ncbi:MAG: anaerobic ribonucleoside-triphosphate reductase activating protein, partial [Actinomyces graevenitzii]|nr:anaerobic ribonucleoside-triphosphate reductase activating protein [Actinomyces graevenitzii]